MYVKSEALGQEKKKLGNTIVVSESVEGRRCVRKGREVASRQNIVDNETTVDSPVTTVLEPRTWWRYIVLVTEVLEVA